MPLVRESSEVSRNRTMYVPHCNATNEHDCDKSLFITDLYLALSYRYRTVSRYLTAVVSAHTWSLTCSHKQPCAIRARTLNLPQMRTCLCILSKSISSHGESWICRRYALRYAIQQTRCTAKSFINQRVCVINYHTLQVGFTHRSSMMLLRLLSIDIFTTCYLNSVYREAKFRIRNTRPSLDEKGSENEKRE